MSAVAETNTTNTSSPAVNTERNYVTPDVNILETPEAYVLEAEMPGVNKESLSVSVENNVLTLVGQRTPAPQAKLLWGESTAADYRRAFALDRTIESARITAKIEQGILTLTLPKVAQVKPLQIAVN